eukprot:jgi/Ulvmu1/4342/UM002_0065.1
MDIGAHQEVEREWELHFRAERKAHMLQQRVELLDTRLESLSKEVKQNQDWEEESLDATRKMAEQLHLARNQTSDVEWKIKVEDAAVHELGSAVANATTKRQASQQKLDDFRIFCEKDHSLLHGKGSKMAAPAFEVPTVR